MIQKGSYIYNAPHRQSQSSSTILYFPIYIFLPLTAFRNENCANLFRHRNLASSIAVWVRENTVKYYFKYLTTEVTSDRQQTPYKLSVGDLACTKNKLHKIMYITPTRIDKLYNNTSSLAIWFRRLGKIRLILFKVIKYGWESVAKFWKRSLPGCRCARTKHQRLDRSDYYGENSD
jgi:hypothetical protein